MGRQLKKGKQIARPGYPQTAQQTKLCHEYVKDYSIVAAARRAGFSEGYIKKSAHGLIKSLAPYIQTLQDKKTTEVVKKVVFDQDSILQVMARAAFTNPQQFVEVYDAEIKQGKKKVKVKRERFRSLMDLTPEEASIVTDVQEGPDGRMVYRLQDPEANRKLLGMNQGMFHQKLIAEHRHAHLHAAMDLTKLDDKKLAEIEGNLIELLGPQAAMLLGHKLEDSDAG